MGIVVTNLEDTPNISLGFLRDRDDERRFVLKLNIN